MELAHTDVTAVSDVTNVTDALGTPGPAGCPYVNSILARVGDKWSVHLVMLLVDGPRRFNELKRLVGGISQRMLTLALRGLERDGLVTRTVHPTIPPRVDYELTALGLSLAHPVRALGSWAFSHQDEVARARAAFDARDRRGPVSAAAG